MSLWRGWRRGTRHDEPVAEATESEPVDTAAARQREHAALCQLRRVEARLRALQAEADTLKGGQ